MHRLKRQLRNGREYIWVFGETLCKKKHKQGQQIYCMYMLNISTSQGNRRENNNQLISLKINVIQKKITTTNRLWRKGNPHTLLLWIYTSSITIENIMKVTQKIKNRTFRYQPKVNNKYIRYLYITMFATALRVKEQNQSKYQWMNRQRKCGL